jgi:hypothetical protein
LNKPGFDNLFQHGVILFVSADLVTNFFGKKGKQAITAVGSAKEVRNLNDLEDFLTPTRNYLGEKSDRWSVAYFFEQTLFVNPKKKTKILVYLGKPD